MDQVIDALPYVDKQPNDDIKIEIDKMLKSELKKINKKKIDKEINEKYKNKEEGIKIKPISISINEEKENINQKLESILNSRSYIYIQKINNQRRILMNKNILKHIIRYLLI